MTEVTLIADLIRDICEMDEPPENDIMAVMVNLDWLKIKLEALLSNHVGEPVAEIRQYAGYGRYCKWHKNSKDVPVGSKLFALVPNAK